MSTRLVDVLLGIGYFVVAIALVGVAILTYDRAFVSSTDVDLKTGPVGNALQKGSDIKLNGVPVGTVAQVSSNGDGAVIKSGNAITFRRETRRRPRSCPPTRPPGCCPRPSSASATSRS